MKRRPKELLKSKKIWIVATLLVVLIVVRALLPYFVTSYINKTLSNIPGRIDDVDIRLIHGAYAIIL